MKTACFVAALLAAAHCFGQVKPDTAEVIRLNSCFGSPRKLLSTFVLFQVDHTREDRTLSNNKNGFGIGMLTCLNATAWFRPVLEINADNFYGTKELRITPDGTHIDSKSGVISAYIGPSVCLVKRIIIAATAGPSFYNKKVHYGFRPSVGVYPLNNRKWILKASYTSIYQKDKISNENFGYYSFALAFKL